MIKLKKWFNNGLFDRYFVYKDEKLLDRGNLIVERYNRTDGVLYCIEDHTKTVFEAWSLKDVKRYLAMHY